MLVDGIVASSMTPFSPSGELRLDLVQGHVDWLIGEGVSGISPLGSSGEYVGLESDDRKRVIEAVVAANNGRVHIMAGTHHYSTHIAADLSRHAEKAGADSLLVAPPYYMHPSINQTLDHYRRLADAVSIPIVVYYNFGGTNIDLRTEHLVKLFEEKAIGGVKLSSVYPDRICELLQATDRQLVVYAGIDTVAFEGLCHGAHGWISALPSIVPRRAVEMYQTIAVKGDLVAARQQWRLLAPLMRLVFREHLGAGNDPNWLSIMKATLNMIGPSVGDPLLPIQPLDPETKKTIAGMVRALGYQVHD